MWKFGGNRQTFQNPIGNQGGTQRKPSFNKVKKVLAGVGIAIVGAVLIFGSFYQIQEQEQAVITTFGKPKAVTETGLHFKIPLIQQVRKVNTTIQGFAIGYVEEDNAVLDSEGIMITEDYNFINVDFYLEYRIADPVQYLYQSKQPEEILRNIAQGDIRSVISTYSVDEVLTTGKSEIQSKIKEDIMEDLEKQDIGIQLVNITIQDSEPPTTEVMQAFKAVETAKQGKETAINNANKYKNEKLPEAEAKADQVIKDAEAKKETRINEAEAQAARFEKMYQEYQKNPMVTKQRMYFEAMEDVLPGLKIVVDNGSGVQKLLPLEPFAQNVSGEQETEKDQEAAQNTAKNQTTENQ